MRIKTDIIWLEEAKSTNDVLKNAISRFDNLSVVSAFLQTGGRGQRENKWHSEGGQNLTFSILLKNLEVKAADQLAVSAATAVSVVEFLSTYNISADIKWPNDIYVDGNKICGILIENGLRGENIDWSVIGIGINVNQVDFPEYLPNPTSIKCEMTKQGTEKNIDLKEALKVYIDIFTENYSKYLIDNQDYSELKKLYVEKLILSSLKSPVQDLPL